MSDSNHWYLTPFVSTNLILSDLDIQLPSLRDQIKEWLSTKVEEINNRIDWWLRSQAEFLQIYKSIVKNNLVDPNLIQVPNTSQRNDSDRKRKNAYSIFTKDSNKINSKRPVRVFSEVDRSFDWDHSILTVSIPSINQFDLKFSLQNEAEINQILYFGYKDSLFYDKKTNQWSKDLKQQSFKVHDVSSNWFYANWSP